MKKIFLVFAVVAVSIFPSLARASWVDDDFNDNSVNASLWTMTADSEGGESEGKMSSFEQNQRLEWLTSSSWTDNSDTSIDYGSKWSFILDQDFTAGVDFHYEHTATFYRDEGGVVLWFYNPLIGSNMPPFISARNKNYGFGC